MEADMEPQNKRRPSRLPALGRWHPCTDRLGVLALAGRVH